MTTGRATRLSTSQGYYWHAMLLGNRTLARRVLTTAKPDNRALAAVLAGMFKVTVRWLRPDLDSPEEIHQFAERVTMRLQAASDVTADEIALLVTEQFADVPEVDITPPRRVAAQWGVIVTATVGLGLAPGNLDRLISEAEGLARQWGIDVVAYRPGPLLRWRFEMAEGRWYGYSARERWRTERMGAFVDWWRD
ncbi:hypothetical protein GCM10028790_58090 [Micromonospora taraxaci]|uniref:Uncharacterized protein n=1 Tax=Micromonospora taraxaci TaxID=1316803 RepID=A0A561W1N3_9ACTN|nr:hypothetical protein [Micromonospora taraxaci]TWG17779.1 hypothetical protein FHU34_113121 [Micromonospora taraxaci]